MDEELPVRTGHRMFLMAWIFLFALLFMFFYLHSQSQSGDYQIEHGILKIKADKQGHYRMKGYINDKPVELLMDTGASYLAIPQDLANQLHLIGLYPITLDTANGKVTGSLTRVESLTFGDFHLKNVKAVIMPENDDLVLLGMNVLSGFNWSQKEKHLIIQK